MSHMSWPLLKAVVRVDVWIPKSICSTVGFACASLRCHIFVSGGNSCRFIVEGSPLLLNFLVVVARAMVVAEAAVAAISMMYRLLASWPKIVMFKESEEIRHLLLPKVKVKPEISRELIERRELRNDGVMRALASYPELAISIIPWKKAMTTESFPNLIGIGEGSFLRD